jgi:hypothetical protein
MTSRRTRRPSKYESDYGDAINKLRNQLGNHPAFEPARDWAIVFCKKVQEKDWRRQRIPAWDSGSRAAHALAIYLERSADHIVTGRLLAAAEQSGVGLKPDSAVRWGMATAAAALRKFLRELSQQKELPPQHRPSRYVPDETNWYVYSPLAVGFRHNQNIVSPHRPLALAVGLTHGFRAITASRHPREEINRLNHNDALKRRGGRPCFEAAAEFANKTFPDDRATSAEAVKKYIDRHRHIRFWWFGDKQRGE